MSQGVEGWPWSDWPVRACGARWPVSSLTPARGLASLSHEPGVEGWLWSDWPVRACGARWPVSLLTPASSCWLPPSHHVPGLAGSRSLGSDSSSSFFVESRWWRETHVTSELFLFLVLKSLWFEARNTSLKRWGLQVLMSSVGLGGWSCWLLI